MYGMTPSAMMLKRSSAPPEKVLKKSRMPPALGLVERAHRDRVDARHGTNDRKRNRTSAPSVNHSRFLSSVALEKFARLMLEASCSAADAIRDRNSPEALPLI